MEDPLLHWTSSPYSLKIKPTPTWNAPKISMILDRWKDKVISFVYLGQMKSRFGATFLNKSLQLGSETKLRATEKEKTFKISQSEKKMKRIQEWQRAEK